MMTPNQFKMHRFQLAGRGVYKANEVDSFMASAAESYESLYREYQNKITQMGVLAETIEKYKQDEDIIKITLINAQRLADSTVKEAKAEADKIVEEAAQKAEQEVASIKSSAEEYVSKSTQQAESFLTRSKTEYDARMAVATEKAREIFEEANAKADAIVSDAKIRAAAAVEQANSQLSALESEYARMISQAQSKLDTLTSMSARFKKDMLDVIARQSALVESMPESASQELAGVKAEVFAPVTSEIAEDNEFTPESFDEEKIFADMEVAEQAQEVVILPEEERVQQAKESEVEPEAEPVEEAKEPEHSRVFEDISSEKPVAPAVSYGMSLEEAESQTDFFDMLEREVKEEIGASKAQAEAEAAAQAKLQQEEAEAQAADDEENEDDYTQPSLFEGLSRGERLRRKLTNFATSGYDDDDVEDIDDDEDTFAEEAVTRRGEPLRFGKKFDIFEDDDDDFDDSFKGRKKGKK